MDLLSIGFWTALLAAAVANGAPLLFGTLGETLSEKSGNLNLGVEGMMYMGGVFGLGAAFYYERIAGDAANGIVAVLLALLFAFLAGSFGAALFSFITITLRVNQNVTGLALAIFGTGVGQFMGEYMRIQAGGFVSVSNNLKGYFQNSPFPQFLRDIPILGPILFNYSIFVYLGVALALVMAYFLKKSRKGLYLRAVGESPATADAAGINVSRYKYLSTILGGGISGIGGMVYSMTIAGCVWNHEGLAGEGWLAVALVIFCMWNPLRTLWGSALFGGLMVLYLYLVLPFFPTQLYKILPYVVTVLVLIGVSMKRKKENQPPASLGNAYFREER
ncbi:MAG: ABC transporter permease [Oscillospiraceae bacterium]